MRGGVEKARKKSPLKIQDGKISRETNTKIRSDRVKSGRELASLYTMWDDDEQKREKKSINHLIKHSRMNEAQQVENHSFFSNCRFCVFRAKVGQMHLG